MSANPFLFTEDDYVSPNSATSNPFLTQDTDNPFVNQEPNMVSNASTNPFAFDPIDLETNEIQRNNAYQSQVPSANSFIDVSSSNDHNFFSVNEVQEAVSIAPQKPTGLDLKYTNTIADDSAGGDARMIPPRPPPSKETQDLLMSVMGAMDATSSHLLDRIPPTRTPSPVSVRDLHSPSPTPETTFGDLLDVGDVKPIVEQKTTNNSTDLLLTFNQENTCDINQNPPLVQQVEKVKPARPGPPIRPPRPQPPKPPPPSFSSATTVVQSTPQANYEMKQRSESPPPKPSPPVAAQTQGAEMMDMFGTEEIPPQKVIASNADILNLYKSPQTRIEPPVKDLLFDTMEPEITETIPVKENIPTQISVEKISPIEVVSTANISVGVTENAVSLQENLSPEALNENLYMDTSDSQSKGSISSITLNPFALNEDSSLQASPSVAAVPTIMETANAFQAEPTAIIDNTYKSQPIINTFVQEEPVQDIFNLGPECNRDDFDAFAQKFESASKDEVKNGVFDAFAQKFESASKDEVKNGAFDAFLGATTADDAWGNDSGFTDSSVGFEGEDTFDAFLALREPPAVPQSTPNKLSKSESQESEEDKDFSVIIRPSTQEDSFGGSVPVLAPPPAPIQNAFTDSSPRFNPFDQSEISSAKIIGQEDAFPIGEVQRTDSQETPPTPLFDEDTSQPLEPFPRIQFDKDGWEMQLRQPNKKKITGQRFWKKIFVRIVTQTDCVLLQLYNQQSDKDPFQELPLQPCYSVSEIGTQQYDQFGKIFTIKLQYIFYKERPGVRPGQVKKAERITNKLSQFAAYAIQGDYQGVKEFGSDLKKLGLPVEHAPQVSQLMKLGSLNYEDLKQFSVSIEEALFTLQAHRDRALHYKMEEVQITAVDELYVEQNAEGHVEKQIARVRLFFLGFLTGMPDIELGINDMRRQGKEVVGRHDIIPVVTEEWIRLEAVEFHNCVQQDEYNNTHIIKFKPLDACYIELLRFRIRPPKNRELPLQLKATICVTGTKVELRADVLVPGFASRKLGQVPCEDVMISFPIPECWIYMFRVEKHFRYGSVKSAHRRTGKIKGIERILGTMDTLQESLIEVTSGQAKYEHQHRAIVWRCPRLPKEGQGAYTTHNMVCRLALTSYDQMPEQLAEYCYVEFTMPATQASHTTVRSVSLQNSDSDDPPEKYVRYLARHEYRVGIEHTQGEGPNAYSVATFTKSAPVQEEHPQPIAEAESSSDSD